MNHWKNNHTTTFYLKKISDPKNGNYVNYYKWSLMKSKLWIRKKENFCSSIKNNNENIVRLWEDYAKSIVHSESRLLDYL